MAFVKLATFVSQREMKLKTMHFMWNFLTQPYKFLPQFYKHVSQIIRKLEIDKIWARKIIDDI